LALELNNIHRFFSPHYGYNNAFRSDYQLFGELRRYSTDFDVMADSQFHPAADAQAGHFIPYLALWPVLPAPFIHWQVHAQVIPGPAYRTPTKGHTYSPKLRHLQKGYPLQEPLSYRFWGGAWIRIRRSWFIFESETGVNLPSWTQLFKFASPNQTPHPQNSPIRERISRDFPALNMRFRHIID
jgi:hypothetical protein